jgi:putative membrane protein
MIDLSIIPVAIALGVVFGFFTGIIPGIHVNTVTALLLTATASIASLGLDVMTQVAFISSLAISHTFFDIIPGLFIGVPGDAVFAQLPGHRLVREGYGKLAIRLSAAGSGFGLLIGVLLSGGLLFASEFAGWKPLEDLEQNLTRYMFFLLLAISIVLILTEKNYFASLAVFLASGLLGILVFNTPIVAGGTNAPVSTIFPALAGLFGIAGLLWSLMTLGQTAEIKIKEDVELKVAETPLPSVRGGFAGIVVGLLPGLGAANAATLLLIVERWLGRGKERRAEDRAYLVTTSSLNTSEAIVAITALYLIQKSRSGASIAIEQLLGGSITIEVLLIILVSMVAGGIASAFLLWYGGPYLAGMVKKMDYPSLNWAVMMFILILAGLLLGIGGVAILMASTIVGIMPLVLDVRRGQLMGFFLVPTMLNFSGAARTVYESLNLERRHAPGEALAVDFVLASLAGALLASLFAYKFIRAKGVSLPSHKTSAGRACVGILIAGIVAFASLLVA